MTTENSATTQESQQQQQEQKAPEQQSQTSETTQESQTSSTDLGADDETKKEGSEGATDLGSDDENQEEAAPPYAEFVGPPEGDYEDFTLPGETVADDELKAEFTPLAKELGLSQKGAQKLVDFKAKLDGIALKRWNSHLGQLKEQAQAHPEIGGAKYKDAIAAGKSVIAKFGTPGLRQMMNSYGVGAHPEMILFMSKIARATGETPSLGNGDGDGVVQDKPLHDLMYKDMK